MRALLRVLESQLRNVARSRWVVGYALLLLLATTLLIRFGGSGERALLSLMNLVLLLLPLVTVVFGTLYVYHAREFIELLLTQPVSRGATYVGLFGGLSLPLVAAFLVGVGGPLGFQLLREPTLARAVVTLLASGVLLTLVFSALALAVAVRIEERSRGFGAALLVWIWCTIVHDGIVVLVLTAFREYPLEGPVLALSFANPVDLARILMLLTLDVSALMGYTGTLFARFFGTGAGFAAATAMLLVCAAVPLWAGYRWFRRKDF